MNGRRDDERFADWVDGRMAPQELAAFERELAADPALAAAAAEYRRTVERVRTGLREDLPRVDLLTAVLARIDGSAPARRGLRLLPFLASLVAAAALVLLVWFGNTGGKVGPDGNQDLARLTQDFDDAEKRRDEPDYKDKGLAGGGGAAKKSERDRAADLVENLKEIAPAERKPEGRQLDESARIARVSEPLPKPQPAAEAPGAPTAPVTDPQNRAEGERAGGEKAAADERAAQIGFLLQDQTRRAGRYTAGNESSVLLVVELPQPVDQLRSRFGEVARRGKDQGSDLLFGYLTTNVERSQLAAGWIQELSLAPLREEAQASRELGETKAPGATAPAAPQPSGPATAGAAAASQPQWRYQAGDRVFVVRGGLEEQNRVAAEIARRAALAGGRAFPLRAPLPVEIRAQLGAQAEAETRTGVEFRIDAGDAASRPRSAPAAAEVPPLYVIVRGG
jgi:hypothetical protein